jgi:hypothetical protein
MMSDISRKRYKFQATLQSKYAPLIKAGRMLEDQISKAEFPLCKVLGQTNLDLWTDGSIYLVNPVTGRRPGFRCLKGLLEFVGDGHSGLYGYSTRLASIDQVLQVECGKL